MAGTTSKPVFVKDGQYMSFTAVATITIGQLVKLMTTGVDVAGAGDNAFGVAVGADRYSRSQTDSTISAGQKVTVLVRGIANVTTDTSNIVVGSFVKAGAAGVVVLDSSPTVAATIGVALETNASAAATIQVRLLRS
jgi:hypothetical protein